MNPEIEKLRQRMVSHDKVVGLKQYPVDDIKKGEKYATALPRWISGDTYEGQMYVIDVATEDMKGRREGVVFRPYYFEAEPNTVQIPQDNIELTRAIVDEIDSRIIELLNNRFNQATELVRLKKKAGLPIDDPKMENKILDDIESRKLAFTEQVKNIYRAVFKEMKELENGK